MLKTSDLLDRVVAQLQTVDGWEQSRHPGEYLRDYLDTADVASRAWAVSVPSTRPLEGRQFRAAGAVQLVVSSVVVRWLYRLRVDSIALDYSRALDAEDVLRVAVLGVGTNAELSIRLDLDRDVEREVLRPGSGPLVFGTLRFLATHQIRNADPA